MKFGKIETGRLRPAEFVDRLLQGLAATPQGQKIINDHNSELAADRKALYEQLEQSDARFIKSRDALHVELKKAEADEMAAHAAVHAAIERANVVRGKFSDAHDVAYATRARVEAELLRTCDPRIDELLNDLQRSRATIGSIMITGDNLPAISNYSRVLAGLIDESKLLKIRYDADVDGVLADIRSREAAAHNAIIQS